MTINLTLLFRCLQIFNYIVRDNWEEIKIMFNHVSRETTKLKVIFIYLARLDKMQRWIPLSNKLFNVNKNITIYDIYSIFIYIFNCISIYLTVVFCDCHIINVRLSKTIWTDPDGRPGYTRVKYCCCPVVSNQL